jgi:hypothetical protein
MSLQDISNPPLNAICGEFNTLRITHRCRKEFRHIKSAKRREGNLTLLTHRKSMRLKEMSAVKQAGGKGETEKGKQPPAQKKRTRTTRQPPLDAGAQFTCFTGTEGQILTQLRQTLLAADAFAAALGALPPDDWSRTWAADRTIMLRRTSKRVKEIVDKMRLPAVVHLS